MRCPNDGETLLMTERSGVEIDYCPTCRGVWLDRGELDKLVEKSRDESSDDEPRAGRRPPPPPPPPPPPRDYDRDRYDRDRYDPRYR
ncbi:MAG TPA: zf-TFIIB domain-containing protein, partial [Acidimicrobiales bacterium]|nr:zf-TFIIB domain-containing protein [Acidimicrobiales bacterium]